MSALSAMHSGSSLSAKFRAASHRRAKPPAVDGAEPLAVEVEAHIGGERSGSHGCVRVGADHERVGAPRRSGEHGAAETGAGVDGHLGVASRQASVVVRGELEDAAAASQMEHAQKGLAEWSGRQLFALRVNADDRRRWPLVRERARGSVYFSGSRWNPVA